MSKLNDLDCQQNLILDIKYKSGQHCSNCEYYFVSESEDIACCGKSNEHEMLIGLYQYHNEISDEAVLMDECYSLYAANCKDYQPEMLKGTCCATGLPFPYKPIHEWAYWVGWGDYSVPVINQEEVDKFEEEYYLEQNSHETLM